MSDKLDEMLIEIGLKWKTKEELIKQVQLKDTKITLLKEKLSELESHAKKLYDALNAAHGYLDENANQRTERICYKVLCDYEIYRDKKN